jgi:hypothetical protein
MKWKWAFPIVERNGIEAAMIRQAISCDICGAEKKQTNHWFVAYTHAGELRVSGWGVQGRVRAGSKHLCGQTCLHKLVDEFIATGATGRVPTPTPEPASGEKPMAASDTSLTSNAAYGKQEPVSIASAEPAVLTRNVAAMPATVIAIAPTRGLQEQLPEAAASVVDDAPDFSSRRWRAEAWERERERERRAGVSVRR